MKEGFLLEFAINEKTFQVYELNDHLVVMEKNYPILVCNIEDDVVWLTKEHINS